MKRVSNKFLKKVLLVLAVTSMSGCVSYSQLSLECAQGNQQACADKYHRDSVMGSMGAGMGNFGAVAISQQSLNSDISAIQQNRMIEALKEKK